MFDIFDRSYIRGLKLLETKMKHGEEIKYVSPRVDERLEKLKELLRRAEVERRDYR